jgi:hypothetical protein
VGRYGERIRSTVFRVDDLARTSAGLAAMGLDVVDGDADDAISFAPEQNKHLHVAFTE